MKYHVKNLYFTHLQTTIYSVLCRLLTLYVAAINKFMLHMVDRSDIPIEAEQQRKLTDIDILVFDQHLVFVRLFFENIGAKRFGDKCDLQVAAVAHVVADSVVQ